MKFKRTICALLCVLLAATCFSCGGEKIHVSIGLAPGVYDAELFAALASEYEEKNPNVEISVSKFVYDENTVTAKAVSGQLPSVFSGVASAAGYLYRRNYIKPALFVYDDMLPFVRDYLVKDGVILGIPSDCTGAGLAVNLGILKEAGIECDLGSETFLSDFDVFHAYAKAVTDSTSAYGFMMLTDDKCGGKQFENIALSLGAEELLSETSPEFDSFACVDALSRIQHMLRRGYVYDKSAYLSVGNAQTAFCNGEVAMCACDYADAAALSSGVGEFAFLPFPSDGAPCTLADCETYFFSTDNEKIRAAALDFLRFAGCLYDSEESARVRRYAANKNVPRISSVTGEIFDGAYFNAESCERFAALFKANAKTDDSPLCGAMYEALDGVLQSLFESPSSVNPYRLLSTAAEEFKEKYY